MYNYNIMVALIRIRKNRLEGYRDINCYILNFIIIIIIIILQ